MPRGVPKKRGPNLLKIAAQLNEDDFEKIQKVQELLRSKAQVEQQLAELTGKPSRKGRKLGPRKKKGAKAVAKAQAKKGGVKSDKAAKAAALLAKRQKADESDEE